MRTGIVYANSTCTTTDPNTGLIVRLTEGEPWAADDPFVNARPGFFAESPLNIRRTAPPIEQASKAPGEKRPVRRAAH
jgi:hypothetical protein